MRARRGSWCRPAPRATPAATPGGATRLRPRGGLGCARGVGRSERGERGSSRAGLGREESWAAGFTGPGGERLGWPECGKERRSWVGPGSSGCWVGHWSEMVWGLGSFSDPFPFLFLFLSKSNPNSNSRQMNSNLNLNSHKHSTNQTMLQHDATTKIKPMINFNYLRNKSLD